MIDVRRGLAEVEAGTPTAEASDREVGLRHARCAGMFSRLLIVEHSRYARHPLIDEAVRIRVRLAEIERVTKVEITDRGERRIRFWQQQHSNHSTGTSR